MIEKDARSIRLKKLDALYITHNLLDCLVVYFCICFTFLRMVYDFCGLSSVRDAYLIAAVFMAVMGPIMRWWARRIFRQFDLSQVL